jgi:hypothetical protein
MIDPRYLAKLMLLSYLAAGILLLTSCAVTYPTKAGDVTFSFNPPPELLNQYGINVLESRAWKDK